MPVNIIIPIMVRFVEIPDIMWLANEIFVWLGGDQEAITCINIEDK